LNNRASFLNGNFVNAQGVYLGEGTENINRLDFSFNYTPIEAVTLTLDVANILAKPFNNYAHYAEDRYYPRDIRDEGRYFGVGARFRF
jgi:outer membrane receptor protein involved in Fe transport